MIFAENLMSAVNFSTCRPSSSCAGYGRPSGPKVRALAISNTLLSLGSSCGSLSNLVLGLAENSWACLSCGGSSATSACSLSQPAAVACTTMESTSPRRTTCRALTSAGNLKAISLWRRGDRTRTQRTASRTRLTARLPLSSHRRLKASFTWLPVGLIPVKLPVFASIGLPPLAAASTVCACTRSKRTARLLSVPNITDPSPPMPFRHTKLLSPSSS
mmetsp:Transcript_14118/g.40009  ORF Transcript_14118/g.40009 Transcript_14118/m.40009 type:complete len:217 (-) Transcript_14118:618-1268(-)